MRLLVLASLAAATSASAAPPAPAGGPTATHAPMVIPVPPGSQCHKGPIFAHAPTPPEARSLTELPPGDTILAVYREKDGCPDPVIVRYGDGRPGPALHGQDRPTTKRSR